MAEVWKYVDSNVGKVKEVKEINKWNYTLRYKTLSNYVDSPKNLKYNKDSTCFDICAAIDNPILLFPGKRVTIPTGICFELDSPMWLRVCDRSGLAAKEGLTTLAGIIDTDYRGEVGIVLYNTNTPLTRYINISNPSEVFSVDGATHISIVDQYGTNSQHINQTFLNSSKQDLKVYLNDAYEVVKYGQIFRFNHGGLIIYDYAYVINPGDNIAQLELPFPYKAVFERVDDVGNTERGSNGFGSSGK